MSLLPVGAISPSQYDINNSLRFRSSATAYLSRTPASAGNRKTWTYSVWAKRGTLGALNWVISSGSTGNGLGLLFRANDTIEAFFFNGSYAFQLLTTQVFRDPSAWYHIVYVYDSTQATASNRVKLYINGSQVTSFTTATYPSLNLDGAMNDAVGHTIGKENGASVYFDGYMAEAYMINGQALTPSNFGETDTTTGVWKPKAYTGTYGTNGFYLKFSDIATTSGSNAGLGKDFSGNTNYWTTNNISVTAGTTYDSMIDSPTLTSATVSNYCVLNPINTLTTATLSNANLAFTTATTGHNAIGSIGMTSGKYYWEAETSAGTTQARATVYGTAASTYYSFAANNTVYGFRFDADAGTLDYTTDGSSFTSLATGLTSGPYFSYFNNNGTTSKTISVNFGQRPFTYTPPTGYNRLNTFNLPDSTIKKGNSYMDATTYTGNGTTQSIANAASFRPDFVWIKSRSSATAWHNLYDSIRGATKQLYSNATNNEVTIANSLTSFNTNGFSVGVDTGTGSFGWNTNAATYVGWQWQAGQGTTSSNTSGSITSTVSVNATAGFSIVTYTGTGANATVGHGLGVAPAMVIVKRRNVAQNWQVRHTSIAVANSIQLNLTNASAAATTVWNSTAPTSTVFSIGTSADVNANTGTYVAYCWSEIAGFSKFGSYTGNGNANGTFVYTGFRPKFVLVKNATTGGAGYNWNIFDSTRDQFNVIDLSLQPNLANAEFTEADLDFTANGFKLRVTNVGLNANGATLIYAAFAENPFKNALAR